LEVDKEGRLLQGGVSIGQLQVADFQQSSALVKQGNNLFRTSDAGVKPTEAPETAVVQGQVESSNVSAPEIAVRIVGVMRQFEMLQKAVTMATEMNRRALEEVAKVNP
jgi:flagellar basal-body rod protein FlgG